MDIQTNSINTKTLAVDSTFHAKQADINAVSVTPPVVNAFPTQPFTTAVNLTVHGPSSFSNVQGPIHLVSDPVVPDLIVQELYYLQTVRTGNMCTVSGLFYLSSTAGFATTLYVPLPHKSSAIVPVYSGSCSPWVNAFTAVPICSNCFINGGQQYARCLIECSAPVVICQIPFTITYVCV